MKGGQTHDVDVHVPDLLVRELAVVLEDVVVLGADGPGELLGDGLSETVSFGEFSSVQPVTPIYRHPLPEW